MENRRRIGIMGGTFDPVHMGHLIAAQEIMISFPLDGVLFLASGTPPHKDPENVTPKAFRQEMLKLAVSDNPRFEVSDIEIQRGGYTYTIDTMKQLRAKYDNDTDLFYIIGADTVPELVKWKNFDELLATTGFIAAERPGYGTPEIKEEAIRLKSEFGAKIHFLNTPEIEISSTTIRDRIRNGVSIRYMVPQAVEDYIYKNALYRGMKS